MDIASMRCRTKHRGQHHSRSMRSPVWHVETSNSLKMKPEWGENTSQKSDICQWSHNFWGLETKKCWLKENSLLGFFFLPQNILRDFVTKWMAACIYKVLSSWAESQENTQSIKADCVEVVMLATSYLAFCKRVVAHGREWEQNNAKLSLRMSNVSQSTVQTLTDIQRSYIARTLSL